MYLDPSFGGMLLQAVVVIAAVGGAVIFSLRKKIAALFSKTGKSKVADTDKNFKNTDNVDDIIDTIADNDK